MVSVRHLRRQPGNCRERLKAAAPLSEQEERPLEKTPLFLGMASRSLQLFSLSRTMNASQRCSPGKSSTQTRGREGAVPKKEKRQLPSPVTIIDSHVSFSLSLSLLSLSLSFLFQLQLTCSRHAVGRDKAQQSEERKGDRASHFVEDGRGGLLIGATFFEKGRKRKKSE